MVDGEHLLLENLLSMWWIGLAAFAAPVLALLTRRTVPDVVWLLVLGVLIGPNALDLAQATESVEFLRELGLGFLFLLAGFEVRPSDMRSKQGTHALLTWLVCAGLGAVAGLLATQGEVQVALVLALASTSTALGTLLPILKDSGAMDSPLGRATMTHGAYGELAPIVAMSVLLSVHGPWQGALILVLFAVLAVATVSVPARFFRRFAGLAKAFGGAADTTMQTTVRATVFVLMTLMLVSAVLDLDVALGAFTAGLLVKALLTPTAPRVADEVAHKVEIVGFSVLIPVFFVTSGMSIEIGAVLAQWPLLLAFIAMIACVRALPVLFREMWTSTHSGLTTFREKAALAMYSATGLPIIVAVTQIAASSGLINETTASVMVTGGAVTVLVFPFVATRLTSSSSRDQLVGSRSAG